VYLRLEGPARCRYVKFILSAVKAFTMNTIKPSSFRILSTFFLCLVVFITNFAGAPSPFRASPAKAIGSLCNYSSWDLTVLLQKDRHPRQTLWATLPKGNCQKERVIGILGSASTNANALPQMVMLNGQVLAFDSLKANPVPGLGLVTIVSPGRAARKASTGEVYGLYRSLARDNPNLTRLGYSLGLESVRLSKPVSNAGYGSTKPLGTPAHSGMNAYAIDFPGYVGRDQRSTRVMVSLGGQVVYSGCTSDFGCATVLRSADINKWGVIYYAVYAHLAQNSLPGLGALVQTGQVFSSMEPVNYWQDTHLHFSMRVSSLAYDGEAALYGNGAMYPIDARMFMR
jgi:hypothetical protein